MNIFKSSTLLTLLIFAIIQYNVQGQEKKQLEKSIYKINKKIEIPITMGIFGVNILGFEYLRNKPKFEPEEVLLLDKMDIWWFDRIAIEQDASFRHKAHDLSDFYLNSSVFLPVFLAFDKNIRKDWKDLLVLYSEAHAINTAFYISVASTTSRARPFNYNADVPIEVKLGTETRNSFFSGHVSSAATASFFMAKVYSDFHPELGNKKYLLMGAASIPPFLVGFYRVKALKHFPTDVITGGIVGAAAGILIPHLHKIKDDESGFSFVPFAGNISGLTVLYTFR